MTAVKVTKKQETTTKKRSMQRKFRRMGEGGVEQNASLRDREPVNIVGRIHENTPVITEARSKERKKNRQKIAL